jgi:hypothetical protein
MTDINGLPTKSSPDETDNLVIQQADGQGFKISIANLLAETRADIAALQAQFNSYIPISQKGAPDGVASLDSDGKILIEQLSTSNNNTKILTFANAGDTNGIFYWLGTDKGQSLWSNPSSQLTYSRQGAGAYDNFATMTDRTVNAHPNNTWLETSPYLQVDLGANLKLVPNYYSLRSWINSDRLPRNWKIQGSNDLTIWADLDTVTNNTSITGGSQWISRPITGESTAYRYFRYTCVSPGDSNNIIEVALGEWEFYGTATIV